MDIKSIVISALFVYHVCLPMTVYHEYKRL